MKMVQLLHLVPLLILTCSLSQAETASENTDGFTLSWELCSGGGWITILICQILCNWFKIVKCEGSPNKYFQTCGDPVCVGGGWREKEGIELCGPDVLVGASCDNPDFACDPINDCNFLIKCTDSDPTTGTGGCPKSSRQSKRDITYLDPNQVQDLARSLLSFNLATWNYKHDSMEIGRRLGFIIDDVLGDPGVASLFDSSPAIDENRGMVDLYGFLSMAVATLQTQQREIDSLRSELELLMKADTTPQECKEHTV